MQYEIVIKDNFLLFPSDHLTQMHTFFEDLLIFIHTITTLYIRVPIKFTSTLCCNIKILVLNTSIYLQMYFDNIVISFECDLHVSQYFAFV